MRERVISATVSSSIGSNGMYLRAIGAHGRSVEGGTYVRVVGRKPCTAAVAKQQQQEQEREREQ